MNKPTIKSVDELISRLRELRKNIKQCRYNRRHPEYLPDYAKTVDWTVREKMAWKEISRISYSLGSDAARLSD
jgi:hypothetical protein